MFQHAKKILREVLSEPGGGLSWGRVASAISLLASLVWVSHIILHTHAMPDLTGTTALVVGPYAAGKVAAAAQSFSDNPVTTTPAAVPPVLPITPPS
jgi:hypothetical protein